MSTLDDLAGMAAVLGVRASREELERWAPLLQALFADLERLRELPIDDREPAFLVGRMSPRREGGPR